MNTTRRRARLGACVAAGLALALQMMPLYAYVLPAAEEFAPAPLRILGEGEMRWLGFKLYDVRLLVAAGASVPEADPHALAIRYARDIDGRRLVDTSIDEMRRLGERDEATLQRWRDELARALPSVRAGDTLVGLHQPGEGARFWHEGRLTAEIDDPELARAFFAIWLDARTREPELRARLLGLDGRAQ